MKKLLLLTFLLVLPVNASAFNPMVVCGGGITTVAGCSTPTTGDTLNEGFIGTGYENTWTEGNGAPDEDFTLEGSPPSGSCAEGLRIYEATEAVESISWDNGSTIARTGDLEIVFSLFVDSNTTGWADWNQQHIVLWSGSDDSVYEGEDAYAIARVKLQHTTSGSFRLMAKGTDTASTVDISLDTWYTVTLHIDGTAADSYYIVDGGGSTTCDVASECTFTRRDTEDGQYLLVGIDNQASATTDYHIGYVYVDIP